MHKKITEQEFLELANNKFNNKFNYGVYKGFCNDIEIECPIHDKFIMTPQRHLNSITGCQKCGRELKKISEIEFLKLATNKFNNKYHYGTYVKFTKDIEIECPIHGKFFDTPQHHLITKTGCPKCGKLEMAKTQSLGLDEFINRANIVHNNKYDYSKFTYVTNKIKSIIICPKHGEFKQSPIKHLGGQGCPYCKTEKNHTPEIIKQQNETKRKNKTFSEAMLG